MKVFTRKVDALHMCHAQTGIVLEVERDVDVLLSTGQYLERQPSTNLQPFIEFQPNQHVLHRDGWFGRLDEVCTNYISNSSELNFQTDPPLLFGLES